MAREPTLSSRSMESGRKKKVLFFVLFLPTTFRTDKLIRMTTAPASTASDFQQKVTALRELFVDDPSGGQSKEGAWNNAWKKSITPWDNLDVQPALKELIEEHWAKTGIDWDKLVRGGEALVAGCGRVSRTVVYKCEEADKERQGYDATFFAQKGFKSLGIDISPLAVSAAQEWLANEKNAPTTVSFACLDFFASPELKPNSFSLAYDYTFFCAIPPRLRARWAERYAELIGPGGVLITLQWPLDGDRQGGPPYSVSPQIYDELLLNNFE